MAWRIDLSFSWNNHQNCPQLPLTEQHRWYNISKSVNTIFCHESDSRIANVCLSVYPSVCPSVIKTPQPLRIMPISQISAYLSLSPLTIKPISQKAYQPLSLSTSSLLNIKSIDHRAYLPSSLLTIKPFDHRAYRPLSLSTIYLIDHQAYQPSSLSTIKPIDHQAC